ncbi:MAG: division/cell wall cluster transcriptional repressor MraZ [Bacteroidales bacterium]|jgi:MraZ protein|nr:division/cell wall cluster transcriptional repressor MraZ [Bacteroidales bacterium]
MVIFTGEYDCKVDAKGRIMLPTAFRKQMGEGELYRFVIKKDPYESCLELFTMDEWERQTKFILKNTNPYDPEHRQLLREFRTGATELDGDNTGRILIPARLLKVAAIDKDTVLLGNIGKIEIWSPELYLNMHKDVEAKSDRFKRILGNVTYNLDDL